MTGRSHGTLTTEVQYGRPGVRIMCPGGMLRQFAAWYFGVLTLKILLVEFPDSTKQTRIYQDKAIVRRIS